MKTTLFNRTLAVLTAVSVFTPASFYAQSALEFAANASNPNGKGSTVNNQVITMQENKNNPVGNTFTTFAPSVTTTFSFSNQQFSLPVGHVSTGTGLSFGTSNNSSNVAAVAADIYPTLNAIGSPSNNMFTALSTLTSGTGIDVSANRGVEIFTSARALYNEGKSTSGRHYFGDITLTFSKPVSNPVLHIVGLGGYFTSSGNMLGFTSELELSSTGLTLSRLSGSSELSVSNNKILNNSLNPNSNSGAGAATGSVLVSGTSITTISFRIYLRGNGGNSNWSSNSMHTGDVWLLGVSFAPIAVLPVKLTAFNASLLKDKVNLKWETASEINVSHFELERSTDGVNFSQAAMVFSYGTADTKANYNYADNVASFQVPVVYYRLRSVDIDGKSELSETRIIRLAKDQSNSISLLTYPNPVMNELRVTVPNNWQNKQTVFELFNANGQIASRKATTGCNQTETINTSNLAPGFYIVRVSCDGQTAQQKVVKH